MRKLRYYFTHLATVFHLADEKTFTAPGNPLWVRADDVEDIVYAATDIAQCLVDNAIQFEVRNIDHYKCIHCQAPFVVNYNDPNGPYIGKHHSDCVVLRAEEFLKI